MNKNLFATNVGPLTDVLNEAGGVAYKFSPKHQLAQYVITGCFTNTYYLNDKEQLDRVLELCNALDDKFIAQCAIYGRQAGFMKDTPSFLVAFLGVKGSKYFDQAFDTVIDNGKMLRNFMQAIRSGQLGRKCFGSTMKRKVQAWLNNVNDYKLMRSYVGASPKLADIIKMVHPKAKDESRNEFFKWILGRPFEMAKLPEPVQSYELFKGDNICTLPDVPFQMLTQVPLKSEQWSKIASQAGWQMLRMNLNTFLRHDVFEIEGMTDMIANKLRDIDAIQKARVYPYQLMTAYMNIEADMPNAIKAALQDALEIATMNVPALNGNIVIGVDISGSMNSPVMGYRGSATSKARYVEVAALFGACILRKNPHATLLPFHGLVVPVDLNPRDSILTNAKKLADRCTNGTTVSSVFKYINYKEMPVDLVIIISDNESWMDSRNTYYSGATESMLQWERIKAKNPKAKLICIDISPNSSTQCVERDDIYNIGGFSDNVFDIVAAIKNIDNKDKDFFVKTIEGYVNLL